MAGVFWSRYPLELLSKFAGRQSFLAGVCELGMGQAGTGSYLNSLMS